MSATAFAALSLLLAAEPSAAAKPVAQPAAGTCLAACCAKLSGAVTAQFECSVEAGYDDQKVTIVVSPEGAVAGVKALLPARVEVAFPLAAGSYGLAAMGAGEARVELASGERYVATGAKGELTLEVDAVERYAAPRQRYRVAGSVRGRLVPVTPGATGEIHLEARF